jgi:hypothetical protein
MNNNITTTPRYNVLINAPKAAGLSFALSTSPSGEAGKYTYSIKNAKIDIPNTYGSFTISFPQELQVSYPNTLPADWTAVKSEGKTKTISFNKGMGSSDRGVNESELETFLDGIKFTNSTPNVFPPDYPDPAKISIFAEHDSYSMMIIDGKPHFYRFVPNDPSDHPYTWFDAYNKAKKQQYRGLTGYLTTITSQEEQDFVFNSIAKNPGWLGGTRALIKATGEKINDQDSLYVPTEEDIDDFLAHYDERIDTNANKWYWADGPEAGQIFYNKASWKDPDPAGEDMLPDAYNNFKENEQPDRSYIKPDSSYANRSYEAFLQFAFGGTPQWNDLTYWVRYPIADPEAFALTLVQGFYVEFSQYGTMKLESGDVEGEALLSQSVICSKLAEAGSCAKSIGAMLNVITSVGGVQEVLGRLIELRAEVGRIQAACDSESDAQAHLDQLKDNMSQFKSIENSLSGKLNASTELLAKIYRMPL